MIRIIKDLNIEAVEIGDPEKIGEGPYKSEEDVRERLAGLKRNAMLRAGSDRLPHMKDG